MVRKFKEEWKVWGNVFDIYTLRNLHNLSNAGYFDRIASPVSVGKEANIFTAIRRGKKPVIIKIYRLQTCDFNRMYDYIKQDPRYIGLKRKRRKIIFAWAQREYRNLLKAREAGVRVPIPLAVRDNILIIEYVGDDYVALQLKNNAPKNKMAFFDKVVEYMGMLWHKAGIVHGDLSHFNILNYRETPVFIDFSQATTTKAVNAMELLERDVKNICNFFRKIGLKVDNEEIKDRILKR